MRMKGYLGDIVHYAFSSAFPISSDTVHGSKEDGPEATLVSDDKDTYVVRKMIAASKTTVLFGTSLRNLISQSLTNHNVFELGLNLILKDRKGNSVPVVYKGVAADRIARTVRTKDGKQMSVQASYLSLLNQMDTGNIPSTPLDYCRAVCTGIMCKEAQ